jgi:hypothetical protein
MKPRALICATVALALALLLAGPALASDGGEGLYGKADDKVITNFGFGLMIFFTVLVTVLSLLQGALAKRKKSK